MSSHAPVSRGRRLVTVAAVTAVLGIASVAVAAAADGPLAGWPTSAAIVPFPPPVLPLAPGPPPPPRPPCERRSKACVDLSAQVAWLLDGRGHVTRGPVRISSGTLEKPTPAGRFRVGRKDIDHVSNISGVPMPYSVFFDSAHGDAFHEGSLQRESDGCVHLQHPDAVAFYDALHLGDPVQIVP